MPGAGVGGVCQGGAGSGGAVECDRAGERLGAVGGDGGRGFGLWGSLRA